LLFCALLSNHFLPALVFRVPRPAVSYPFSD